MALTVTPGFGTTVATMEVSGTHHQQVISYSHMLLSSAIASAVEGQFTNDGWAISSLLTFNNVTRIAGRSALLKQLELRIIDPTAVGTGGYRLVLFRNPRTIDRGAWIAINDADLFSEILGIIDIPAPKMLNTSSGTAKVGAITVPLHQYITPVNGTNVYGALLSAGSNTHSYSNNTKINVQLLLQSE